MPKLSDGEVERIAELISQAQKACVHLSEGTYLESEDEHRALMAAILEDAARKVQP